MSVNEFPWKRCAVCSDVYTFSSAKEFMSHLRERHCRREGGSYVCHYGANGVCSSLPLEGVSDADYDQHVRSHHVKMRRHDNEPSRRHDDLVAGLTVGGATVHCASRTPNVVADGIRWSVHQVSQNLPALLNDPSRGRQKDLFTKAWGDSFTSKYVPVSTSLPHVDIDDFAHYLRAITTRQRAQNTAETRADSSSHPPAKIRSDMQLSVIPRFWFDPSFDLRQPQTFALICPEAVTSRSADSVSQVSTVSQASSARDSVRAPPHVHDQLTQYLDVVEVHIAAQIADRSEEFFDAVSCHDSLMDQLQQATNTVQQLRRLVWQVREGQLSAAVKLWRSQQLRSRCSAVTSKLQLMSTIKQTQPTIQLLLASGDFVGAHDLVTTSQHVLHHELAGLRAFRHLDNQLSEMRTVIGKMASADFLRLITADLNRPLDVAGTVEQEQLVPVLLGLLRLKCLHVVEVYKDEALTAVRAVVKQLIVEILAEADSDGCEAEVAPPIRQLEEAQLTARHWLSLVRHTCHTLVKLLDRIKSFSEVVGEVVDVAAGCVQSRQMSDNSDDAADSRASLVHHSVVEGDEGGGMTVEERDRMRRSLVAMVTALCDYMHERVADMLQTCLKKDSADVRLFTSLSSVIDQFVTECQQISARRSTAALHVLHNHASKYVQRFHSERRSRLLVLLESERWKPVKVSQQLQQLVDTALPADETGMRLTFEDEMSESVDESAVSRGRGGTDNTHLTVLGRRYCVVPCVLFLLRLVLDYCRYSQQLAGSVAAELLLRLVELLQLYNSRSCLLLVGGAAVQRRLLRTISLRHLCVSAGCIQLINSLLPRVTSVFQTVLCGGNTSLRHLRQVCADYDSHAAEVHAKLVKIVCDACENQLNKWTAKPPVPSDTFRSVCSAVSKLHEAAVSASLSHCVRAGLVRAVHDSLITSLTRHVTGRLHVTPDGGPQHGVVTSELALYCQRMTQLDCPVEAEQISSRLWLNITTTTPYTTTPYTTTTTPYTTTTTHYTTTTTPYTTTNTPYTTTTTPYTTTTTPYTTTTTPYTTTTTPYTTTPYTTTTTPYTTTTTPYTTTPYTTTCDQVVDACAGDEEDIY